MVQGAVWVVGEALVDCFPSGPVAGGAPFNVARSLAQLGQSVRFVSRVGADDAGARLIADSARSFGLGMDLVQADAQHPTGEVQVVPGAQEGHAFRIGQNSAWDHMEAAPALEALRHRSPALLYFGTLAQRHLASRSAIRQLAARSPCCYLDLNLREGPDNRQLAQDSLDLADWVKVNEDELHQLLDWFVPGVPGAYALTQLMQRFALRRLIVTRGEAGYACFGADGQCLAQGPAPALDQIADTVGAGDAFSAMFIAAHNRGIPLAEALELANSYAAWICTVPGPVPADATRLQPWQDRLTAAIPPSQEHSPWRV